ncbi:MAG: hypothetical protein ACLS2X_02700 [Coprococcus sp.]
MHEKTEEAWSIDEIARAVMIFFLLCGYEYVLAYHNLLDDWQMTESFPLCAAHCCRTYRGIREVSASHQVSLII